MRNFFSSKDVRNRYVSRKKTETTDIICMLPQLHERIFNVANADPR